MKIRSILSLAVFIWAMFALANGQSAPPAAPSGCDGGYRVHGELRDRTLGRSWTVLASCGHPEAPWIAVRSGSATLPLAVAGVAPEPVSNPVQQIRAGAGAGAGVRAGDKVTVWKQDAQVRVVMTGIAIEAAKVGAPLRVRIPSRSIVLNGIARSSTSVEWAGPGRTQWVERAP